MVVSVPACRAPCTAPAAPPSLCISMTDGTEPQILGWPADDHWSAHSPIGGGWRNGIDGDYFVNLMSDIGGRFVAVDRDLRAFIHNHPSNVHLHEMDPHKCLWLLARTRRTAWISRTF